MGSTGRHFSCLGLAVLLTLLLACGDPAGPTTEPKPFVFTPVPYVTDRPATGDPMLVILDEQGRPAYIADELIVSIEREQKDSFLAWLATPGFELKQLLNEDQPRLDFLVAILKVPPGSVFDAQRLVAQQVGVRSADLNSILVADGE